MLVRLAQWSLQKCPQQIRQGNNHKDGRFDLRLRLTYTLTFAQVRRREELRLASCDRVAELVGRITANNVPVTTKAAQQQLALTCTWPRSLWTMTVKQTYFVKTTPKKCCSRISGQTQNTTTMTPPQNNIPRKGIKGQRKSFPKSKICKYGAYRTRGGATTQYHAGEHLYNIIPGIRQSRATWTALRTACVRKFARGGRESSSAVERVADRTSDQIGLASASRTAGCKVGKKNGQRRPIFSHGRTSI